MRIRRHIYFDKAVGQRLDAHVVQSGVSASAFVSDAVRIVLDQRGAKELDGLLGTRLKRLERDQQVILETLALFVRYQLTVTAPLPEADQSALAVGQDRFQAFIDQVGRRIASGRGLNHDLLMRETTEKAA